MVAPCEVMAVGAHPDDVELGAGATLARLAAAGRRVGILDLTAGEAATRGDVETRAREAQTSRQALSAAWRHCLSLPDGGLDAGDPEQVAAVVAALRAGRPRALLIHHTGDPHPDHAAAADLVAKGSFLSGVAGWRRELSAPHRPRLLLAYPGPRQLLAPDLVVDVTASYSAKRSALAAYASQFQPGAGAATHLASGHFLAAVEGRDRAAGNTIGCQLGEGFATLGLLPADEIAWLLASPRDPRGALHREGV